MRLGSCRLISAQPLIYKVNHLGILYKLCSVSIGCSVLSVLTRVLSNQAHYFIGDGCRSKVVKVVSGVPQGRALARYSYCIIPTVYLRAFSHSGE